MGTRITWAGDFRSDQTGNGLFDGNKNYLNGRFLFLSNEKWTVWWERELPEKEILVLIKRQPGCLMGTRITWAGSSRSDQTKNGLFDGNENYPRWQFLFSSNEERPVWWERELSMHRRLVLIKQKKYYLIRPRLIIIVHQHTNFSILFACSPLPVGSSFALVVLLTGSELCGLDPFIAVILIPSFLYNVESYTSMQEYYRYT